MTVQNSAPFSIHKFEMFLRHRRHGAYRTFPRPAVSDNRQSGICPDPASYARLPRIWSAGMSAPAFAMKHLAAPGCHVLTGSAGDARHLSHNGGPIGAIGKVRAARCARGASGAGRDRKGSAFNFLNRRIYWYRLFKQFSCVIFNCEQNKGGASALQYFQSKTHGGLRRQRDR